MELEKIREVLVKILGVAPDEITLETKFDEDLGADSLDLYQAMVVLEEEFRIQFIPDKIGNINTVSEAVAYIKNARNNEEAL